MGAKTCPGYSRLRLVPPLLAVLSVLCLFLVVRNQVRCPRALVVHPHTPPQLDAVQKDVPDPTQARFLPVVVSGGQSMGLGKVASPDVPWTQPGK